MGFIPRPVQRGGKGSRRGSRRGRGKRRSKRAEREGEEEEAEEEEAEGVRAAEEQASAQGGKFLNALLSQTAAAMVADLKRSPGSRRVVRRALMELAEKRGRSIRVMR